MRAYLGIDIGTTNTKALLIGEDGQRLWSASKLTPHVRKEEVEYFALRQLEEIVDDFIAQAGRLHLLKGVAFSSVGESVVPIKNGKALGDPVMWYEAVACQDEGEDAILQKWAGYERTGLPHSTYYSVGKILWMRRRLEQTPEIWLPLTSYMVWRKTGCISWDNSQACRSYLYDIHERTWIEPLLGALSLEAPGSLDYMGAVCGERDGILYGLGGHDHMTGLHAIYDMLGDCSFYYDSMGTSSVLALVIDADREKLKERGAYNGKGGCVVSGFRQGQYIVTRSFRHYGALLATLMGVGGNAATPQDYEALNGRIQGCMTRQLESMFANYGDLILGYRGKDAINLLSLAPGATLDELMRSAYIYLAVTGAMEYEELAKVGRRDLPYYAGGAIVKNELFMQVKATAIEHGITVLDVSEIGALGAALIAARANGDEAAIAAVAQRYLGGTVVQPREEWVKSLQKAKSQYGELKEKLEKVTME